MSDNEIGVESPYESMSKAAKAEEMVTELLDLGTEFRGLIDDLSDAASTHVSSALREYEELTVDALSAVVDSGINLASDVEGANLSILESDHESADQVDAALADLNGLTRPANG